MAFGIMLVIAGFRVRSERGGGKQAEQGRVGAGFKPARFSIPPSARTASRFHLEGKPATCSVARATGAWAR